MTASPPSPYQDCQLGEIATRAVACLAGGDSVNAAARLMAERNISCIVVCDGRNMPLGIVTERDMLRAMRGEAGPETRLDSFMSTPVFSLSYSVPCELAYRICLDRSIRHLVVLDAEGQLYGVVSETDFRTHMHLTTLAGKRLVAAVMSRTVLSLGPQAGLGEALNLMHGHRESCVVVVAGKRPVGIVTERDVVRLFSQGRGGDGLQLAQVMASPVLGIPMEAPVKEAAERMLATGKRHLVVLDQEGGLAGLISEHDLTRTMAVSLADARLETERIFLRTLIDTLPDLVWLKDPNGVYLACNQAFQRLLGVDEAAILGRMDQDFVAPERAERHRASDRQALQDNGPVRHDEWVEHPDGRRELLDITKTPMRDSTGQIIGILGIGHNVTAAREAENRLKESEEKLRGLFELSPLGIALTSMDGRFIEVNRAFERISGYALHELRRLDYWTLTPESYRPEETMQMASLQSIGRYGPYEKEYIRKDGRRVPLRLNGVLVTGRDGLPAIWSIVEDISAQKHWEKELQDSLRFARQLIETIPNPVFYKDREGRYLGCNSAFSAFLGRPREEIVGRSVYDLAPRELADTYHAADEALYAHPGTQVYESRVQAAGGETRNVVFHKAAFTRADGSLGGLVGVILDISERVRAEENLRLAASVFANSQEGILITDAGNRIVDANPAFTRITGYRREEVLGKDPKMLSSGRQSPAFYAEMWESLAARNAWRGEIWNKRKNGECYAELLSVATVRDERGSLLRYVGVFSDISQLKAHEAELDRIANYDPLTGVPNRRLLSDRLNHAVAHAQRQGRSFALCYFDLDGFKAVNDRLGHEMGDRLLVEITHHLKGVLRNEDTLARLGGDEFVLLFNELASEDECFTILDRVLSVISSPVDLAGHPVSVSASIGVTLFPRDDGDPDTLLRHADQAMYRAKESGKNRYHLYNPRQDQQMGGQGETRQRLRQAMDQGEFLLYYQPKVNLASGEVLGVEALLRWQHPQRGLLLPGDFLPGLRGTDLDPELGDWVLDRVLGQIEAWKRLGLDLPVSVNISAEHLRQPDFASRVGKALERHPMAFPVDLELEILESAAIRDLESASRTLALCQLMGLRLTIDDFGTGYSSLNYFRKLPVGTLKIDRAFIHDMLDDPEDLGMVESILRMAQAFNRAVVAEGVETLEHGAMLMHIGCQIGQGFSIAKPMPAPRIPEWIAQWRGESTWSEFNAVRLPTGDAVLTMAATSHRHWVEQVAASINTPGLDIPRLHSHQCRFGRWYHGSGYGSYGHLAEFTALDPVHEQIHALASELLALAGNGGRRTALARLPELFTLRDRFLAMLDRLIQRVRSDGPGQ